MATSDNEQLAFRITREIGIDAAHRVPDHASKCCHLHGHRYTIQAKCAGILQDEGQERGMVMDFGFLKEEMMAIMDKDCDHALILWARDPWMAQVVETSLVLVLIREVEVNGFAVYYRGGALPLRLYVIDRPPTAEVLAEHWFRRLAKAVTNRIQGRGKLVQLRVYETPNCWADYPASQLEA